eukprot:TRINITY_DN16992_c1_g1_i1.p1 TRINITY_DN16992_c1_g1~~TRINITY_DN16992_c1_g1_i1.p1  ORF type:complete len:488 (-),score=107.92 TRINITY_DN16992_c1_g1_i1:27-1490(-)
MRAFVCLFLFLALVFSKSNLGKKSYLDHDVCILGAGASGMSAATFLDDRGYDVLILEKEDRFGGHCHTERFHSHEPIDWLDWGVQIFPDSGYDNNTGIGSWSLDSRKFAERFAPGTINYLNFSRVPASNYAFDFTNQIPIGNNLPLPSGPTTPEYIAAYINLQTILATRYPWIENADIPDPIPQELLLPLSDFIANNNLGPLEAPLFYPILFYGGMGNHRNVTALFALQNLRRGVTAMFSTPAAGFYVKNGCHSIYEGMARYLGKKNIILETEILGIRRRNSEVRINYREGGSKNKINQVTCGKLIVSFPQLLDKMDFLDLDEEETSIFSKVEANHYYTMLIDVQGPMADSSFNLANVNALAADKIPPFPSILVLKRPMTYGPAAVYSYSLNDDSEAHMYNVVDSQLKLIPSAILTRASIVKTSKHYYQAHFNSTTLASSPTPYTLLNNLQGNKNTYWTGALFSFAETVSVWEKTFDLINTHFPFKK